MFVEEGGGCLVGFGDLDEQVVEYCGSRARSTLVVGGDAASG